MRLVPRLVLRGNVVSPQIAFHNEKNFHRNWVWCIFVRTAWMKLAIQICAVLL